MENTEITLVDFYKKFREALKKDKFELKKVYSDRRKYTNKIQEIMKNMYSRKDYLYSPEWLTIDYTWWNQPKQSSKNHVHIYEWGECLLAVEHENDWMDWTYELMKLDAIHARVKVVIGYSDNDVRNNEIEIVKKQNNYFHHTELEKVGVILLNKDLDESSNNPFNAKLYILSKDSVEQYPASGAVPGIG